jgi:uncharacterized protein (DUF1499 family)
VKILLYTVIGIIVIIGVILVGLSIASRKQPELGLLNGQLRPCPATPNCVCSEQRVEGAYVEPIGYTTAADEAWRKMKQAIVETGGEVATDQNGYLHAIYETPLMRYVDDVEFRLDENQQLIHIRSASRVGKSDLGANRKRVVRIRATFEKSINLESKVQ